MKKLLLIALLGIAFYSTAQEIEDTDFKKNEVKINMFWLILEHVEISYERNLSDVSSVGISFLFPMGDVEVKEFNYAITPYYRLFFGNKPAQGFFLEAFGMINSTDEYTYHSRWPEEGFYEKRSTTDFALGVGVGGKFVLKDKIVAEVCGGLGRNLIESNDNDYFYLVPRAIIGVGYRF